MIERGGTVRTVAFARRRKEEVETKSVQLIKIDACS